VTGIKHQEEHGGESGEDGEIAKIGIPISPLTGRRSRSKQGTVFSIQAENISRMFGDGAREHIAMATSNASVSARDPIPRVLATDGRRLTRINPADCADRIEVGMLMSWDPRHSR
jgi:hypothetical protein